MSDIDNLRLAANYARYTSHDPRTQNGAVLVAGTKSVAAANVYPLASWRRHGEPPSKYAYIEHAERAAIYKAAQAGYTTAGSTLYVVWFACPDCARAIIAAGVSTVVGSLHARVATPERWEKDVSLGESMLRDAGVNTRWLAEKLGVTIIFDGKELSL
jgi:deoxycytidylate deaminase